MNHGFPEDLAPARFERANLLSYPADVCSKDDLETHAAEDQSCAGEEQHGDRRGT